MKIYLRLLIAYFVFGVTNANAQTPMKDSIIVYGGTTAPTFPPFTYPQWNAYGVANMSTDQLIFRNPTLGIRTIGMVSDILASPSLTGTPTAPTAATSTNSTQVATTAYVKNVISTIPLAPARVFNNNVSRSLNSNYTISTTRDALVTYSIAISVTNPLLAGSSTGSAFLEYSTNAGSSWTTVSQVVNASSVGVAVAIALTQPNTFILSGMIPANALTRIRSTTAGTASVTYSLGSETYL